MENLITEAYDSERDKLAIRAMLCGEGYLDEVFQENEKNFHDGLFVAYYNDLIAGFLSVNNFRRGRGAKTILFVSKEYRRKGIGTKLMERADTFLSRCVAVERSIVTCIDGDRSSLQFLYKNGYYINYSSYIMEREGKTLIEENIFVRQYEDEDYLACHKISEIAFFKMREHVGMLPSYYFPPDEGERKSFLRNRNNRFVMLIGGEIAGVGVINGNELRHVAVRPELQGRGYGRAFVSFLVNEIMRRGEKIVKLGVVKGSRKKII